MNKEEEKKKAAVTPALKHVIATAQRDHTYPLYAHNMFKLIDATLLYRGHSYSSDALKLYDEIERDNFAYSLIQKRKNAVIARDWVVDPASDDPQDVAAAEFVEECLKAINFDKLCEDLMDAIVKGFATVELIWGVRDGKIIIERYLPINQRRIMFDADRKPRLVTMTNRLDGEELPDRKFAVHRFGDKIGNPYGLGMGTRLFWPVFFKREGIASWMVFLEKFASPTAMGEYKPGMAPADQETLLDSLSAIAQQTAITVPEGSNVSLLEAARSGGADTYKLNLDFMNMEMSVAMLGETLSTTMGDNGARAASETHNDVRQELTDGDCDLLSDTLGETVIRWLLDFNMPAARTPRVRRPQIENEQAKTDLEKSKADVVKTMSEAGYQPTDEKMEAMFGEGWERKAKPSMPSLSPDQPSFADRGDQSPLDNAGQLEAFAGKLTDQFINDIKLKITRANSPEEVQEILAVAYAENPLDTFAEYIAQGIALSELEGMSEVEEDAA
jgi:phage gp29-like protein